MTPTPGEGRPLTDRLVSPNGFDGYGPVPDKVYVAARKIAKLRTRFVSQWTPGCEQPLATTEVDALFQAAAVRAEWERELIEARDALTRERDEALDDYARDMSFCSAKCIAAEAQVAHYREALERIAEFSDEPEAQMAQETLDSLS